MTAVTIHSDFGAHENKIGHTFFFCPFYLLWSKTCMQVRKQQLELGMEQQIGSKKEKEYVKAYIVTLLI